MKIGTEIKKRFTTTLIAPVITFLAIKFGLPIELAEQLVYMVIAYLTGQTMTDLYLIKKRLKTS